MWSTLRFISVNVFHHQLKKPHLDTVLMIPSSHTQMFVLSSALVSFEPDVSKIMGLF